MNYRNHFTSRAIKAIEFAQYAARELEQDYIGTEHILLGLLHEEGSVAFAALQAAGLTFDAVMQRVEAMVAGDAEYPSDNPYYTPRASAGRMTASRCAWRAANISRVSVSSETCDCTSSNRLRRLSPTGVPPGSRVTTRLMPRAVR